VHGLPHALNGSIRLIRVIGIGVERDLVQELQGACCQEGLGDANREAAVDPGDGTCDDCSVRLRGTHRFCHLQREGRICVDARPCMQRLAAGEGGTERNTCEIIDNR